MGGECSHESVSTFKGDTKGILRRTQAVSHGRGHSPHLLNSAALLAVAA